MTDGDPNTCDGCGQKLNVLGFCPTCAANGPPEFPAPPEVIAGEEDLAAADEVEQSEQQVPRDESPVAKNQEVAPIETRVIDDASFKARLSAYKARNVPAAVFIGFQAAGKTWLLLRYMHWLSEQRGVDFLSHVPSAASEDPDSRVGGTTNLEFMDAVIGGRQSIFIDTPGEYTQRLARGEVQGIGQLVASLDYASALMIALPADIVLFGPAARRLRPGRIDELIAESLKGLNPTPQMERDLRGWVENLRVQTMAVRAFADGLGLAAGALSLVRSLQSDCFDEKFKNITPDAIIAHLGTPNEFKPVGGATGLTCPAFFALTKADRVVAALFGDQPFTEVGSELNDLKNELIQMPQTRFLHALAKHCGFVDRKRYPLDHPADFVRNVNPQLHHKLTRFFPMGRFDFVTAFFGHDYTDALNEEHYADLPAHGIDHMHDWLGAARRIAANGERRLSEHNLARQLYLYVNAVQTGRVSIFDS